jgi:hypothetical protein
MKKILVSAVLVSLAYAVPAIAHNEGSLPKGAVPLTPAETKAVYVGNTATYNVDGGKVYYTFTPAGKLLGIADKADGSHHVADGSWTVSGNKFCFNALWKDASGKTVFKYAPCKAWWKSGSELWTKMVSGDEAKYIGDINNGEARNISKGDKVSGRMASLKAVN